MAAEDDPEVKKHEMSEEAEPETGGFRSGLSRWLRRIIIVLLIFVLLVAVAWFALIGPKAAELSKLQTDLANVQQQNVTLEAQIADLQSLKAQRSILSLLVDANAARFELAKGDKASAAAAILNTGNTLYQLDLELGDEYGETISSLNTRLSLIREGIQSDSDVASLNDLEVFVDMLTNLLQSLLSQ